MIDRDVQVITQGFKEGRHNGVDLRSVDVEGKTYAKQRVVAPADIEVLRCSLFDGVDGYGNDFLVCSLVDKSEHADILKFIHISFYRGFQKGDIIKKGEQIGFTMISDEYIPPRSNSTAQHLHFETWKEGIAQDPCKFFADLNIPYKMK